MEEPKDFSLLDEDEDSGVSYNQQQQQQQQTSSSLDIQTKLNTKNNNNNNNNQSQGFKFSISPNRPSVTKIEFKSIDRPRSHSPLKLNGIEDYIQQYEKRKSIENLNTHIPNKITMNLKMDDLLAAKNEQTSYQMLNDFSVLTGDIDEFTSRGKNRKQSIDHAKDNKDDDLDDENNDDSDDEQITKDQNNLNYKFTAVYKKDVNTGAFQEQSKIVFENKQTNMQPIRPKPPVPAPPPPPSTSNSTKSQIELALEALRNNSEKLDKKLEKLDDITPSSNSYYDTSLTPQTPEAPLPPELPEIKKKNEDFFNDILSKSDNLIAQTQHKLERLSKLESVNKPLAPLIDSKPPAPKPKPTASLITPDTINTSKSLIDLKTSQSQINIPESCIINNQHESANQVDLLFDINTNTQFIPVFEPIKQGSSYVDLLGLDTNENNTETTNESNNEFSINSDLLGLSMPQQEIVSSIDIHISEPTNEINDNNIVPDDYFNLKHEIPKDQSRPHSPSCQASPKPSRPQSPIVSNDKKENAIKEVKKVTKTIWNKGDSQGESSSSFDNDDDDDEVENKKIQIRIRPKANRVNSNIDESKTFVPLLPKPPKSVEELEEFRQRRFSSDNASITNSIRGESDSSSSDEEIVQAKIEVNDARKESVHSEFNLELPDDDDSLPLSEFNEKSELTKYSDGTYGCIVLVRQPFRNANVMYKNALQKVTEVRSWTECLVKLVDSETGGKKIIFFNAHELMTLAAEKDTTIENIIETCVINNMELKNESEQDQKIRPFHEIELRTSYKFTDMCLQQYDNFSKIHTFKIQDIVFKETIQMRPDRLMALPERFFKKFTKAKVTSLLDHTPIPFEICKFGHLSHSYLKSFLLLLQDAFWSLPTITRKKQREEQLTQIQSQPVTTSMSITAAAASLFSLGSNKPIQNPSLNTITSNHTREEITVKVVDEYRAKLDKECRIIEHKSRTRVYLIAFLNSPDPAIEIGLNDVMRHGKEIVGRCDIIPIKTEQWISPELFELNEKVVDKEEFEKTHCLKCVQMPDNLLVEIMRFRTRPRRNYELPLQVRSFMSVVNRHVEIRIECTVAGGYFTNLSDVYCEDIQIRFPLPDVWVYLFRVEKMFRYGAVHSTKSKLGKIKGLDRLLVHKNTHHAAIMEASCGMAKYEQAFKSLVWRIDQLPVKNKDIYKTQLFVCRLNLQEYDQFPDKYDDLAQVQYSIPICASSKCQVRSVSVNTCDEPPEKWAKLKSKFEYDLEINYAFDQNEIPKVDLDKCAELQHLSQTESEGDNNEDDD